MQIVDNKAIVLRTRRPHLITERIQKSKVLKETDGMFDVAIHWGLTEGKHSQTYVSKTYPRQSSVITSGLASTHLLTTKRRQPHS
jgi:hypothetical protein